MTPSVNGFLSLDFLPLMFPTPAHFSLHCLKNSMFKTQLRHHGAIPHPHPHPGQTSHKPSPVAFSDLSPSPTLPVHVYPRFLPHGGEHLFVGSPASPFRLEDKGSCSEYILKSTGDLLKIKPITISWDGAHKTRRLPKWFSVHKVENCYHQTQE